MMTPRTDLLHKWHRVIATELAQIVTHSRADGVSSVGWSLLRQAWEDLGDLSHALGSTFAEEQPWSNGDVLRTIEESEGDDGLLIGLNAALTITQTRPSTMNMSAMTRITVGQNQQEARLLPRNRTSASTSHWRLSKLIICTVRDNHLFMMNSNYSSMMHLFWDVAR